MNDLPLLDYAERSKEAERLRERGMGMAVDHADAVHADWRESAFDFLVAFAQAREFFISEDVSNHSKTVGFPQPPTDRAWGSVYTRAAKKGLIVKDGIGRSLRRHASICPRWRSLVFQKQGGAEC